MSPASCYFDGQYRPIESAAVPISDLGFVHGATVTEQLRTAGGLPWLLDRHLDRFANGLALLHIQLTETREEIAAIVQRLVEEFLRETSENDCGIGFFATPGATSRWGQPETGPLFCVYCYRLPHAELQRLHARGFEIRISEIRDVSSACWPKDVKIRSRLHYYLADLRARGEGFTPILADEQGNLRDTSIAAPIFVFERQRLTIPPRDSILDSVGLQYAIELGRELDFEIERREVHGSEIERLQAMLLTNSLFGLAPVRCIQSHALEQASPEWRQLAHLWTTRCGMELGVK